jgi:hypothetical protein
MKHTITLDQCVSRNISSSSIQRSTQRNLSGISLATAPTTVSVSSTSTSQHKQQTNTASGLNAQLLKQRVKSNQVKRRIQIQHGKASAIVVDPRKILRLSIVVVASACCYLICHSLVRTLNDEAAKHMRGGSTERYEKKSNDKSTKLPVSLHGKEPLLNILKEAGITDLDQNIIDRLPTWEEVTYVHFL